MRNDNTHGHVDGDMMRSFGRHAQIKAEDTEFQGAGHYIELAPRTRNPPAELQDKPKTCCDQYCEYIYTLETRLEFETSRPYE